MIRAALTALGILAAGGAAIVTTGPTASNAPPERAYQAFANARQLTLSGYTGDAMEPFISADGRRLLFNSSNAPGANTDLFSVERSASGRFGKPVRLAFANSPALDGVPSLDRDGNLYFVSIRSYAETLSTLYRVPFGARGKPELIPGISPHKPGIVQFDAEVSWDGKSIWISEGQFSGKPFPDRAKLVLAHRAGAGFRYDPQSDRLLSTVNRSGLNYAAAISRDGLELFFTRAHPGQAPAILRAVRSATSKPFGEPQPVAAIIGHVEAPSLSANGMTLYYHKLIAGKFVLCQVSRKKR